MRSIPSPPPQYSPITTPTLTYPPPQPTKHKDSPIPPPPRQDIAYVRSIITADLPDNLKHQAEGQVVAPKAKA